MRFRFPARATLGLLPLAVAFAWLAHWQWQRMHEKSILQAQFEQPRSLSYPAAIESPDAYVRVELTGRYNSDWHLLRDNRMEAGRPGVEVHSLFRPNQGPALLVNRGWLPMAADRRSVPSVPTPAETLTITGRLAPPPAAGVRLGEPDSLAELAGPTLVTYLELARVAAVLDEEISPSILLLDAADASGFGARAWKPAEMLPEQHQAYAVQWSALALAVVIMWFTLAFRRRALPEPGSHGRPRP